VSEDIEARVRSLEASRMNIFGVLLIAVFGAMMALAVIGWAIVHDKACVPLNETVERCIATMDMVTIP